MRGKVCYGVMTKREGTFVEEISFLVFVYVYLCDDDDDEGG